MDDTTTPDTGEEQPDAEEQRSERAAKGCLLVIGVAAAGTIAVTVPETAYYAAGLLTTAGIRRARTWATRRRSHTTDEPEAEDHIEVVDALHALSKGGQHVLLTDLKNHAGLPDTKAVRRLLDEAGIPIRSGVRAGGKNGPGVHHDDIPPLSTDHEPGCLCRSDTNTNTNNSPEEGPEKGLRVATIGHAGLVVTDPTETQRRHTKTPARST
ncbi:hypothetical protein OG393_21045 [Streptomyces sp. NBC_01216]|uniref:hypothetical protein n=1 Tax=Streptomyces sp. NBC_01216 TaxID=2903778 RepID=UPI002E104AB7|nr:hypothetical protein OG393_21045 [Streptomyces sp. NBC_01216]